MDDKTIQYVKNRPFAPSGAIWDEAEAYWRTLTSDADAKFDTTLRISADGLAPQVSWGTSPEFVIGIDETIPAPEDFDDDIKAEVAARALDYMGLDSGVAITDVTLDKVFIGSCTNARIEDLRVAAAIAEHRKVASTIKQALVVPGSGLVKQQAEAEGLHEIFLAAGFEWRDPGCSMCLAMNNDRLYAGERCASTSNRNFEGRQGHGGRTHLVSPAMAAIAAIEGHFADVREYL